MSPQDTDAPPVRCQGHQEEITGLLDVCGRMWARGEPDAPTDRRDLQADTKEEGYTGGSARCLQAMAVVTVDHLSKNQSKSSPLPAPIDIGQDPVRSKNCLFRRKFFH